MIVVFLLAQLLISKEGKNAPIYTKGIVQDALSDTAEADFEMVLFSSQRKKITLCPTIRTLRWRNSETLIISG